MITMTLPYTSPPLRSNKRLHHMAEWRKKRDIRHAGNVAGQEVRYSSRVMTPLPVPVHIRMVWTVPTRHRRDADSGQPTLKSYIDGLVDAGVLQDDNYERVPRAWCEIEYRPGEPMSLRVEITEAR
jgi:Holliday junction resolvase RusA-like endonuclease